MSVCYGTHVVGICEWPRAMIECLNPHTYCHKNANTLTPTLSDDKDDGMTEAQVRARTKVVKEGGHVVLLILGKGLWHQVEAVMASLRYQSLTFPSFLPS